MKRFVWLVILAFASTLVFACSGAVNEASSNPSGSEDIGTESQALSSCYVSRISLGVWYSQNDSMWKNVLLGNSSTDTIGNYGCVLTCLSMTYQDQWLTSTTPSQLNSSAKSAGCFGPGSSLIDVSCAINSRGGPHSVTDLGSLSAVATTICANRPVMIDVPWGSGHKVLAYGYNGGSTSSASSYLIVDPWDGTSKYLSIFGTSTRWRDLN